MSHTRTALCVCRCYTADGGSGGQPHTVREVLTIPRGGWRLLTISHSLPYLSLLKRSEVKARG